MIRVLVKASSAIARAGLEGLLQAYPGVQLITGPSNGVSPAGPESLPDVLVVEAETLGDDSAREAIDWASAGGAVVLLLRNPGGESIAEALRGGVKAVLPSGLAGAEITAAVEAAASGLVVLDGGGAEMLLRSPTPVSRSDLEPLVEALNKEVASRLEISEHTVKFHVASIMGKLGASSRTEAVTLGIRHGFVLV
jgi:DNA-binding NarL/FixJ family response regulator